jgi:hypothetical protein
MRINKRNHVPLGCVSVLHAESRTLRGDSSCCSASGYTRSHKENMEMLLKFSHDLPVSLVRAKGSSAVVSPWEPRSKAANIASWGLESK